MPLNLKTRITNFLAPKRQPYIINPSENTVINHIKTGAAKIMAVISPSQSQSHPHPQSQPNRYFQSIEERALMQELDNELHSIERTISELNLSYRAADRDEIRYYDDHVQCLETMIAVIEKYQRSTSTKDYRSLKQKCDSLLEHLKNYIEEDREKIRELRSKI